MDGFFSGLGFGSSKKTKLAETKTDKQTSPKNNQPSVEPAQTSKAEASNLSINTNVVTPKPAINNSNTSDRSSNMRLSKNPPKKVDNDFDIPSDTISPSPSYTSSSTNIGTKVEPKITPSATIGPKISFKGELSGEEDLLVQGYVEGTITLKNNHLTIGKLGTVKANISAKTITVEGTVEGDIIGQEKVEIKATSNVSGNLKADRVTLEDGAKFRGSIDMGTPSSSKPTPENTHTARPTTTSSSTISSSSPSSSPSSPPPKADKV